MPRHHRSPRLPAPALLAGLLLLALGACRPDTPQAPVAAAADEAAPARSPATAVAEAAAALNPLADPRAEVNASMQKFIAASSYHASMHIDGGADGSMTNELDFVAPDRYRMTMQHVGTQTIIGDTMYMNMRGQTMKMPLPGDTLSRWRDPARLEENQADTTVRALGREAVDGTPARKYVVHHTKPQPADVTMWIGDDDLPLQIRVAGTAQGHSATTTIRYSRFNDSSIEITPPQ